MSKSKDQFNRAKKNEFFYKKAKKINARARSYFKLEAVDTIFNLVKENKSILDLGCSPGAWLQYIDSKLEKPKVLGIDLLRVERQQEFSDGVKIVQGDFNEVLKDEEEEFDLILSDMAPEFSGDAKIDRGRTHKINLDTIELSKRLLKKKGDLVIKTFEGTDIDLVRKALKKNFFKLREYKPGSSKKGSAEFYLVGLSKK